MATQTLPIGAFSASGVSVSLEYDDITLVVSAILALNPNGVSASVTVTKNGVPSVRSIDPSVGGTPNRYPVPGSVTLTTVQNKLGGAELRAGATWGVVVAVPA